MKIRTAEIQDLPHVLSLYAQPSMDNGKVLSLEEAQNLFSKNAHTEQTLYIVEHESTIIASFTIIIIQMLSRCGGRMGMIEDIVVSTESQGKGVGSLIMDFATTKCMTEGCYRIAMVSGAHREEAHAFFQAKGFKLQGYAFSLEGSDAHLIDSHHQRQT